ncbi:MAG: hypothetical protein Q7K03_08400 [Dehalococcoidia bacterium]|nr:hypothetical protein [Dehalococcoidia bacterium]
MKVEVRNANEIAARLRRALPTVYPRLSMSVGYELARIMAKYPGKVRYPIAWKSRKQRRWYFWYRYQMESGRAQARAIRLGRGQARMRKASTFMPYRRGSDQTSQQLGGGWRVDRQGNNARVNNPVRYAAYVQGSKDQQPFHRNTGWATTGQGTDKLLRGNQIKKIFHQQLKLTLGGLVK